MTAAQMGAVFTISDNCGRRRNMPLDEWFREKYPPKHCRLLRANDPSLTESSSTDAPLYLGTIEEVRWFFDAKTQCALAIHRHEFGPRTLALLANHRYWEASFGPRWKDPWDFDNPAGAAITEAIFSRDPASLGRAWCPPNADTKNPPPSYWDTHHELPCVADPHEMARHAVALPSMPANAPTPPAKASVDRPILDPRAPLSSAREFVARRHMVGNLRTLHHHRGEFFRWDGPAYRSADESEIRAALYDFLDCARTVGKDEKAQPFKPDRAKVGDMFDALRAAANLPSSLSPPTWLGTAADLYPDPGECIVVANGLLHLPPRKLHPATPAFFSVNALPVAFDPDAPYPKAWFAFLKSLWPDDSESIKTLQEIMGYALVPDTRQQKLFLLVGPKRSGKGTIARMLTAMLGTDNVVSPSLGSFGTNFGLEPLIGKMLATLTDARLGGRADQSAIAERLLSISGEDIVTLDRKFRSAWTGRLPTRFLILTNEVPRIADASGAFSSRFIVLALTQSFYGREDLGLGNSIAAELPGIFNWCLAGLDGLRERGYFRQPASARQVVEELETLGAPVAAFVKDCCRVAPGLTTEIDVLYRAWQDWCTRNGRREPGTKQTFGRDLRAAVPGLMVSQPRTSQGRQRLYEGIDLQ